MKADKIVIPRWFDRHLHLRTREMLKAVLPCTLNQRATGAVIMGNLPYPYETSSIEKTLVYQKEILSLVPQGCDFRPRMTCYLTDDITPEEVVRGFEEDVWCAVKLYLAGQGGTTGSRHGVKNLSGRYRVFEAMEKRGIPLLGHFEVVEPEVDEFDREIVSVERDLFPILASFPGLPVVVEHVTDGRTADFVAEANRNIQATVTPHHLTFNRNEMFFNGMNPSFYCKPVLKNEKHRLWVRKYVTSGNRRFGAGTDSAPHYEENKACWYGCAAGIFTAPLAIKMYAKIFDEDDASENLSMFLSENFLHLYGMEVSSEMMTIERTSQPQQGIGTMQIFGREIELPWRIAG